MLLNEKKETKRDEFRFVVHINFLHLQPFPASSTCLCFDDLRREYGYILLARFIFIAYIPCSKVFYYYFHLELVYLRRTNFAWLTCLVQITLKRYNRFRGLESLDVTFNFSPFHPRKAKYIFLHKFILQHNCAR